MTDEDVIQSLGRGIGHLVASFQSVGLPSPTAIYVDAETGMVLRGLRLKGPPSCAREAPDWCCTIRGVKIHAERH